MIGKGIEFLSFSRVLGKKRGGADVVAALIMIFALGVPFSLAGEKPRQSKPRNLEKPNCGGGVALRLSSPEASQGNLLLLELRNARQLTDVKGNWDGKEISFWSVDQPGANALHLWRALLGVDLEQPAGKYEITVSAQSPVGDAVNCLGSVAIHAGHFATESLHVDKQFVEPNAEQLARAKAEQQRLRELFAQATPERLWRGHFRVPLDGIKTGGNFGRRRILNGQPGSPHSGMDFPAPTGTPVYASQAGRVVLAEPLYFSGNTVVVDHGLGVYTLYGHLDSIVVSVGDAIGEGTVLGRVGATGRVTGPHLHWGLTVNRARVNPLQIVSLLDGK
jgi:hypothetical protein